MTTKSNYWSVLEKVKDAAYHAASNTQQGFDYLCKKSFISMQNFLHFKISKIIYIKELF